MAISAEKDLSLDIEAERLVNEASGRSARGFSVPGLSERLHEEQKKADARSVLLVRFFTDCADAISAASKGVMDKAGTLEARIKDALDVMGRMPERPGGLVIRFRGRHLPSEGKASARNDYEVILGSARLDAVAVGGVAKRTATATLKADFLRAASVFTSLGINTLHFTLFDEDEDQDGMSEKSLSALLSYFYSVSVEEGDCSEGQGPCITVIRDAIGEPAADLSILAAVNGVKPSAINEMAEKVRTLMDKAPPDSPLLQYVSVSAAAFAFEKLKAQLKRPAVSVNNMRWLFVADDSDALPPPSAAVVRFSSVLFGSDSRKAARLATGLYADDYGRIDPVELVERLKLASDLLAALDRHSASKEVLVGHVLSTLRADLELVPDNILESITFSNRQAEAEVPGTGSVRRALDERVFDLCLFFQSRATVRKKMKAMVRESVRFDNADCTALSRDFDMSPEAARELLELVGSCFDKTGHFQRAVFDQNIPAFARHHKVFEFLWHFLKEHMHRAERIAFLNALKVLIDQMKEPKRALRVLLEDFARDPQAVNFYDRNGLMLANLLLRTFTKELHQNIETTPEEVLQVVKGLDPERTAFARSIIDAEKERFFLKVKTIHRERQEALDPKTASFAMPPAYLLSLEREIYIFFSLVGGVAAVATLRSALREYGDPHSELYRLAKGGKHLLDVLGILQIILRGVKRIGERSDQVYASQIKAQTLEFMDLKKTPETAEAVKKIMKWL